MLSVTMREMSPEEIREFLTAGTRTGKAAVVRADGRPMVVPIWFDLDDDETLVFTTWHESVKARALRREPRISICVDREEPPYDYVRVDGMAEVIDNSELVRRWATRLGARYMGAERAEEFGAKNGVPGELLVRVTPTRVVGRAEVAG
jgi:PPOX class probable F420-dependent enzyme